MYHQTDFGLSDLRISGKCSRCHRTRCRCSNQSVNQSHNHTTSQSIHRRERAHEACYSELLSLGFDPLIASKATNKFDGDLMKSIEWLYSKIRSNQSNTQSNSQSVNHSNSQSNNQSTDHSTNHTPRSTTSDSSSYQPIYSPSSSTYRSINQSNNQSPAQHSRSSSFSMKGSSVTVNVHTDTPDRPANQTRRQPADEVYNQSNNHLTDQSTMPATKRSLGLALADESPNQPDNQQSTNQRPRLNSDASKQPIKQLAKPVDLSVLDQFVQSLPVPQSINLSADQKHATFVQVYQSVLVPQLSSSTMKCDCRDKSDKWLEAEIIDRKQPDNQSTKQGYTITIHYIGWDNKWDEKFDLRAEPERIAPFHSRSRLSPLLEGDPVVLSINQSIVQSKEVYVYVDLPKHSMRGWFRRPVTKMEHAQILVRLASTPVNQSSSQPTNPKVINRWFEIFGDCIITIDRASELFRESVIHSAHPTSNENDHLSASKSNNQPIAQLPIKQSNGKKTSRSDFLNSIASYRPVNQPIHPSISSSNRSNNQSISQTQNQSIYQSFVSKPYSPYQSVRSINGSAHQSISQSNKQTTSQPNNYSVSRLIDHPSCWFPGQIVEVCLNSPTSPPANQSANQLNNSNTILIDVDMHDDSPTQSNNQSVNQQWYVGEILYLDPSEPRARVHIDGLIDRWIDYRNGPSSSPSNNQSRYPMIRPLGSSLQSNEEELEKTEVDRMFRQLINQSINQSILDMEGDGNCLFRCIAHCVYGHARHHPRVRAECCTYMSSHSEYFSQFIDGSIDDYIDRLKQPNEWGDQVEIEAMRELYDCNIIVYDRRIQRIDPSNKQSNNQTKNQPNHETDDRLTSEVLDQMSNQSNTLQVSLVMTGEVIPQLPVIRLSFHGGNHYNVLIDQSNNQSNTALFPLTFNSSIDCQGIIRALRIDREEKAKLIKQSKDQSIKQEIKPIEERSIINEMIRYP